MRVKVGNKIYDGTDAPIMVIFDEYDRVNLKMALDNTSWKGTLSTNKPNYFETEEKKIEWLNDLGEVNPWIKHGKLYNYMRREFDF